MAQNRRTRRAEAQHTAKWGRRAEPRAAADRKRELKERILVAAREDDLSEHPAVARVTRERKATAPQTDWMPLQAVAGMAAAGFPAYVIAEAALSERLHPLHWLVAVAGGLVGYIGGLLVYRRRGYWENWMTTSYFEETRRGLLLFPQVFRQFGVRSWLFVAAAAAGSMATIGILTAIVPNPLFVRMTPVRDQDYVLWAATGLLVGLIAGTYALREAISHKGLASGGLMSVLAVGCPVCNKLVVLLIGTSGALTFFAPLQLYLGLGALGLLAWSLWLRVNALAGSCPAKL